MSLLVLVSLIFLFFYFLLLLPVSACREFFLTLFFQSSLFSSFHYNVFCYPMWRCPVRAPLPILFTSFITHIKRLLQCTIPPHLRCLHPLGVLVWGFVHGSMVLFFSLFFFLIKQLVLKSKKIGGSAAGQTKRIEKRQKLCLFSLSTQLTTTTVLQVNTIFFSPFCFPALSAQTKDPTFFSTLLATKKRFGCISN